MDQFPKAVYAYPGSDVDLQDGRYGMAIANDADDLAGLLAAGFFERALDARSAHDSKDDAVDDSPATRDELEAKAAELGIKVDGRWSDKKLAEAVAAALK